jgi:hypothetical protein
VAAGHERRHLLVARLDELDGVLMTPESAQDAVDSVAGIAVDPLHAPLVESLEHEIGGCLRHAPS